MEIIQRMRNLMDMFLSHGGKRDYLSVLGYNKDVCSEDFLPMFRRGSLAFRICKAYPDACFSYDYEISRVAGIPDELSEKWKQLKKKLKFHNRAHKLDISANLGRYAIMVIGVNDGKKMDTPIGKFTEIAYLRPYLEHNCKVSKLVADSSNPRFGMPELYTMTHTTANNGRDNKLSTFECHYSRVIHVAYNCLEDDVFGISILEPIYDLVKDLNYKVIGGFAEINWLNARGGIGINIDPQADLDDTVKDDIKSQIEDYYHQLRRSLVLQGASINSLKNDPSSNLKDPVDCYLNIITATTGIPKRLLIGNEAGELASSQDQTTWENRVSERAEHNVIPKIIVPFVEFCMEHNIIEQEDFEVYITRGDKSSPFEKAKTAELNTSAISKFATAVLSGFKGIGEKQFVEEILHLKYDPVEDEEDSFLDEENEDIMDQALEEEFNGPNQNS